MKDAVKKLAALMMTIALIVGLSATATATEPDYEVPPPIASNFRWSTENPGEFSFDVRATLTDLSNYFSIDNERIDFVNGYEYFNIDIMRDGERIGIISEGFHTNSEPYVFTSRITDAIPPHYVLEGEASIALEPGDYTLEVNFEGIQSPVYTFPPSPAVADENKSAEDELDGVASVTVTYNGEAINFTQPPVERNGYLFYPLEDVFQTFIGGHGWDGENYVVSGQLNGNVVEIPLRDLAYWINGTKF